MRQGKEIMRGLWLLRSGLALYFVLSAIDKIISPESSIALFPVIFSLQINQSGVMILGSLELALSLLFFFGMYKTFTYGTALLIQSAAMLNHFYSLIWPWGENHWAIFYVPIFFALLALFNLRRLDNLWSLGKKPNLFASQ